MSCCGTAKEKPGLSGQRIPQNTGIVTSQPQLQPMMEKSPQFNQLLSVSPPPQVHTNTFNNNTGFQQPQMTGNQQWGHTSPSTPPKTLNDFGSFNTATSSTALGASAYSGSLVNSQASHTTPQASFLRSASPPSSNILYGQPNGAPQHDEGKMSVSIDFGKSFAFSSLLQ